MEIKVPDIILSTLNLELTLKHIKDLCTFFCQIWICIETYIILKPGTLSEDSVDVNCMFREIFKFREDMSKNRFREFIKVFIKSRNLNISRK